jgi:dTMP kinase
MHPRTETLLYQAARAQFVEQIVFPHLKEGEIVISDRFYDSTFAYQGYGHRQDIKEISPIIRYAAGGLTPDLTVFFDVDVETGLSRRNGTTEWNRMDALPHDFHERVRRGYQELVKAEPERWVTVDANKSIDEVFTDLRQKVEARLASNGFLERPGFGPER